MKTFLRLLFIFSPIFMKAQIITPIPKAGFGVDADLRANYFNGFVQSGDDWFNNGTAGTGLFVIDTNGAAARIAGYLTDASPWPRRMASFYKGMSRPPGAVGSRLWLDALFVRDYHGTDTTVFIIASKNGQSPALWDGGIQGVPDKNDILDISMHIRRNGLGLTPGVVDSLWMFGTISMDRPDGNRYFDFEMYQTDISYDRISQKWYGYGPDAGHTSWLFDAAGNVTKAGDIILTGSFQSSVLDSIRARIWVSKSDWQTVAPTGFSWDGSFDGDGAGATYGYAGIQPKTAGAYYIMLECANNTWGGPFGVVLQDNSLQYTAPAPASTLNSSYSATQLMEFAVNLTKLGLDPVTTFGSDICGTPFNRLVVKTRASESFTSSLKDFVAPTDLFLAPRVAALADVPIFCDSIGVSTLQVQNPSATNTYTWTTPDGHIVGPTTGTTITVDSPGTYIVAQRLAAACNPYAYDTLSIIFDSTCTTLDNNLMSFKGAINNGITRLDWTVSQNGNVSYYDIERSYDGRFFDFVSRVDPDPDKELSASYSAYDDLTHIAVKPAIFYRLKIKNKSGGTSYSKIIRIPYGFALTRVSIAPNPVRDMMQITINTANKNEMELYLYDMTGKAVRKIKTDIQAGTNAISIDNLSTLQSGMYLVVVTTGEEIFRQKIVLAK